MFWILETWGRRRTMRMPPDPSTRTAPVATDSWRIPLPRPIKQNSSTYSPPPFLNATRIIPTKLPMYILDYSFVLYNPIFNSFTTKHSRSRRRKENEKYEARIVMISFGRIIIKNQRHQTCRSFINCYILLWVDDPTNQIIELYTCVIRICNKWTSSFFDQNRPWPLKKIVWE